MFKLISMYFRHTGDLILHLHSLKFMPTTTIVLSAAKSIHTLNN